MDEIHKPTAKEIFERKQKIQFLILYHNFERFAVLKYLDQEYLKSNSLVCNKFFITTMHVYYERIVIDLAKLFVNRDNDWFNFTKTVEHLKFNKLIENQSIMKAEGILNGLNDEIEILSNLRDNEIAHHNKYKMVISANIRHLDKIELLLNQGKEILLLISPRGYEFNDNETLLSLKSMISQLSR